MGYFLGIDIGSTSTKTTVLDDGGTVVSLITQPTGWSSTDTAETLRSRLTDEGYFSDDTVCVATGYGRVSVPYADKTVTEISCHAKGAISLYKTNTLTVIDIGGQDTKIIRIEKGQVTDFIMNDKCSAGTGRFLEVMANRLALRLGELCSMAENGKNVTISSLCTVFAESEVISLIGRGEKKENIAYAVVDSVVKKVSSQAHRIEAKDGPVCLTGGLSSIPYISRALSRELHTEILSDKQGIYSGAIGAAIYARELQTRWHQ